MEYLGYELIEDRRGWHCPALGLFRYRSDDALMHAMRRELGKRTGHRRSVPREAWV